MHFRGQREFVWNGYRVRISVPGWHHANMAEIAAAFHDRAKDEPREAGTLSMEQLGAEIRKKTRSGTGEFPLSQPGRKTREARV